ncbi:MAG TPA: hypothetical protein VH639_28875 [Bryobacteraceae bacterium]|jgi:hypothetical protein
MVEMRQHIIKVLLGALIAVVGCNGGFAAGGQDSSNLIHGSPDVYRAFLTNSSIVTGRITSVRPIETLMGKRGSQSSQGMVTVSITNRLRGDVSSPEITISYIVNAPNSKYPPFGWSRVPPVEGMNVLLFLTGPTPHWEAVEILDLQRDEDKAWVPVIRKMLSLEADAARGEKAPLFQALGGDDRVIRSLACELLLTRVCANDNEGRMKVLQQLVSVAGDTHRKLTDRTWAVSNIAHSVITGSRPNDPADQAAIASLALVLTYPETELRSEAVQTLDSLFFGIGTTKFSLHVTPAVREQALRQLQKDGESNIYFASQARQLVPLFRTRE